MPDSKLKYDPSSPEGREISALFRDIKRNIEDDGGGWNGADIVDALNAFFARLGIDTEGSVHQVDPVPPQAVSPSDHPDTVAEILAAHRDFTTNGRPSGREGFFYAQTAHDRRTDYTLLAFPCTGAARIRTALAVLRALGYTATELAPAADTSIELRLIAVEAGALHPLAEDARAADRALRLLHDAGFTGFLRGCPGLQAGGESDSCGAGQGKPDRRQGDSASATAASRSTSSR
ncbi:hypothetical protein ABT269_22380 [Streptomyces viridosporus]|uniref:hypothetical protein n=1 Tax=Streptomyces viridosporus TaxID=67581 RepID=UPI003323423D